jgi:hypothetical protein
MARLGGHVEVDVAALLLRRDDLGALHDVADDPHIAAHLLVCGTW